MKSREITPQEVKKYREDGFVHLKGLLSSEWVDQATRIFEELMAKPPATPSEGNLVEAVDMLKEVGADPVTKDADQASGRFLIRTYEWLNVPDLEHLGCSAPLPEVAATLFGADRINFYGDQSFLKDAGSQHRTAFHQDTPYFHISGQQCCTIWMPLDVVDDENSPMGYVRGSHRWKTYAPNVFVSQMKVPGSALEQLPDIEGHEQDYDIEYVTCAPGDAIVHQANTVHGSKGNVSKTRGRRALSLRYLGDDIRYQFQENTVPDSLVAPSLKDGDLMDSPEFPLIWTKDDGYLHAT